MLAARATYEPAGVCGDPEPCSSLVLDDGRNSDLSSRKLLDASDDARSVVLSDDSVSPPSSLMRLGIARASEADLGAINSPFELRQRRALACDAKADR
jgi:hypothetical protein